MTIEPPPSLHLSNGAADKQIDIQTDTHNERDAEAREHSEMICMKGVANVKEGRPKME